ncbi:hypothetical protein K501DRAFT_315797 [Backusella circina FSU 941]|nr:hypothetical protein K501DRAFT_315797 [Backusella circina FSU 941]
MTTQRQEETATPITPTVSPMISQVRFPLNDNTIVVASNETSIRSPPVFSGYGNHADPLKFLKGFRDAAAWNNWITEKRKKDLFVRCMQGYAQDRIEFNFDTSYDSFNEMPFDDSTERSLVKRFKREFVSPEWLERYEMEYKNRKQLKGESPWKYMHIKRTLLKHYDPYTVQKKSEELIVAEIRRGLLPEVKSLVDAFELNPALPSEDRRIKTYAGLEGVLRWIEKQTAL